MEIFSKKKWDALRKAARKGDAEAQWHVGYCREYGAVTEGGKPLVKRKLKKALRWYLRAAGQGHAWAQISLGNIYGTPGSAENDFEQAIFWTQKAIDQGSGAAAHNMATIYRDLGKPQQSFASYEQAITLGDHGSLLELAQCYLFGYGVRRDFGAARRFLEAVLAADPSKTTPRTREHAQYWLGVLMLMGLDERNATAEEARGFLLLANADDDHEQANEVLNIVGRQ